VIFVDTSFWAAIRNRRDQHHDAAVALLDRHGGESFITTNHVRGETWTLLRRRVGHASAADFLDEVERSARLRIVFVEPELEDDALSRLLPDAGDRLEAGSVLECDRATQLRRRGTGDDRQRHLRPDAADAEEMHEEVAFLDGAESVELERVLADVQVRLHRQLVAGAPQDRRRRLHQVAHAVHIEHEACSGEPGALAAQPRDHAAALLGAVA